MEWGIRRVSKLVRGAEVKITVDVWKFQAQEKIGAADCEVDPGD